MENLTVRMIVAFILSCLFILLLGTCSAQGQEKIVRQTVNSSDYALLYKKFFENGFSQKEVEDILKTLVLEKKIMDPEKRKESYARLFKPEYIVRGKDFLVQNDSLLDWIKNIYKIQKTYVVSVYMVETDLGKNLGEFLVPNAIFSNWYVKNKAADFYQELADWYYICRTEKWNSHDYPSSSAGAFGKCQFLSSSYRKYAVDGNGDGKKDLFDLVDALFSMANYLCENGWGKGGREDIKKALWAYNRSSAYGKAVMDFANAIVSK